MDYKGIKNHFTQANSVLKTFLSDDENFKTIEKAGHLIVGALLNGNKVISCGNGGSMCDAMHFAEELSGRYREDRRAMAAIAISDVSHITCTANDYGFDRVFSRFVEGLGNKNDVLFAISTSGNSANILNAIKAAKQKGMKVIGLTGKDGGEMKNLCDIEIRVSHTGYSDRIKEVHIKIIHSLIDFIENKISPADIID
ncbi:D-sedoheptulose 7-phosphate isomerase [Pedobacter sp. SD-b]|uniref:Phosphoheptose isomerase n=1 Tax=Pedobacter segetis TaxID=2793069 RepID=A0ABS1BF88_9SPHI|nr:D-sedoheptulose 7-phosphate isomerase [Pedobacter segetis]MBK0381508.1 D-sedoheptulose 7-phosphate isomerase [Pedobacter segetis]